LYEIRCWDVGDTVIVVELFVPLLVADFAAFVGCIGAVDLIWNGDVQLLLDFLEHLPDLLERRIRRWSHWLSFPRRKTSKSCCRTRYKWVGGISSYFFQPIIQIVKLRLTLTSLP
jgi:hypothetical protein